MFKGLWSRQDRDESLVHTGAIFRHRMPGNMVEVAEVLDVRPDHSGIPHVSFQVRMERSHLEEYVDRRKLNLETFTKRYEERVTS